MVSTQTNIHQSPRRPKNKMRTKRTKRRVSRRTIGTTPSDSKSSLENNEPQTPPPMNDNKPEDVVLETKIKKRSLSEERQPSRVKIGQRSASLQLESTHVSQPSLRIASSVVSRRHQQIPPKKKAWFFSWPVRLVVPNRTTIEDEGFDSFHGNNSSSSDCENDENRAHENNSQSNVTGLGGLAEMKTCEKSTICRNGSLKLESQSSNLKSTLKGNIDCQGNCFSVKFCFFFCKS